MKRLLVILSLASLVACHGPLSNHRADDTKDIHGAWSGTLSAAGAPHNIVLTFTQADTSLSGTFLLDYGSNGQGNISGTISSQEIDVTADPGSNCVTKMTVRGEWQTDERMLVSIQGGDGTAACHAQVPFASGLVYRE